MSQLVDGFSFLISILYFFRLNQLKVKVYPFLKRAVWYRVSNLHFVDFVYQNTNLLSMKSWNRLKGKNAMIIILRFPYFHPEILTWIKAYLGKSFNLYLVTIRVFSCCLQHQTFSFYTFFKVYSSTYFKTRSIDFWFLMLSVI